MNPKHMTILGVAVAEAAILSPLAYFNLYIFGGIDFPNKSFGTAYWISWWLLVYGGALVVVVAAVLLVRRFNISYPSLLGLLSLPLVAQAVAIVLYFELTDRYGLLCC